MVVPEATECWAVDSEWGFRDGRIGQESAWEPVLFCALGLRSARRFYFWGRDTGLHAFIHEHCNDRSISHYAVAEMLFMLRQGVPLPTCWFDTFVAFRYATNKPGNLEAGLAPALHRLGMPGMVQSEKKVLQQKILNLHFDLNDPTDQQEIRDYCFSDCDGTGALYHRLAGVVPPEIMAHWIEYLKAVARMELRGIPLDVAMYERILANQTAIRKRLIGDVNTQKIIYFGEKFNKKLFLDWCRGEGIEWPVKTSKTTGQPYLSFDKEVMKDMEGRHPLIAEIRQVNKTLDQLKKHTLLVDPMLRRHFYGTSVFRSVTGRNQPRNFIFSGPKWLRFLIVSESEDHVLVYVDFVAQEVGIAASLSSDPIMRVMYEADDCHMAFAVRAGAAPPGSNKKSHPDIRKRYKMVNLGVLYGQTAFGAAARLGIPYADAEVILADHRALFPVFWRWSERFVQGSYDRGYMMTPCGWRSQVPFFSKPTTWMNWPMQSTGGDLMRLTIIYLDRQNVRILAPVHDGFLLSCRRTQLADLREAVDYACQKAVDHVLPGFPLRWDFTLFENGRFEDEDGLSLWQRLQQIIVEKVA